MLWFGNTDHGPRALVECANGHQLIEDYRSGQTMVAQGPVEQIPARPTSQTQPC